MADRYVTVGYGRLLHLARMIEGRLVPLCNIHNGRDSDRKARKITEVTRRKGEGRVCLRCRGWKVTK